ncbi:MAG: amidohydrolase [Bacteroidia bacterium]|nr:amidohydrolase [Bacteroidia bacterium]
MMKSIYSKFFYQIFLILVIAIVLSCSQKTKVDYILKDAHIYTLNANNDTAQAMAVSKNKIIAIGTNDEILKNFTSDSIVSLKGKYVYPAFIDAHAHFFGLAHFLGECNLYGAKSIEEIIQRLKNFYKTHSHKQWIIGRGWDQNLFLNKSFPNKTTLDSVFPNIPVCLTRVDGHAIWTNSKAIEIAGITSTTNISGGKIILDAKNQPSGIFIDNATQLIEKHIPSMSRKELVELLIKADELCWKQGIHTICEAGLDQWQIQLLDSLIDVGKLKLRFYVMASLNPTNWKYLLSQGKIDKEKLKVRAFKIYLDGALGSRGALLKQPYADITTDKYYGLQLIPTDSFNNVLKTLYEKDFQVCTHAIGDSANKLALQMYAQHLKTKNDKRWRIEHAQIVDSIDRFYFGAYSILPSVQPTHAISDKNWAIERLGKHRIKFGYCYQSLWEQQNILPIGTDFPVEDISPFKSFFAAVFRCDYDLRDTTPFQKEEALTRFQALRGMTYDAAYACFMEKEIGSLEYSKQADYIVLDIDLFHIDKESLSKYIFLHQQ